VSLADKKCVPCRGDDPPLTAEQIEPLAKQLVDWNVEGEKKLYKEYSFKNFVKAMDFANAITKVAEEEGHHPDLFIAWGKVIVSLWTHNVDGLSDSDFIMADKIDRVFSQL